jgi:feruloyl-CoA synthase
MRETPYVTPTLIDIEKRADGALILSNPHPLQAAFDNVIAPLEYWSKHAPNKTWLAGKENGVWREVSYSQGLAIVRNLAGHLDRLLPPGCVVAIGSSNSLNHAFLTYALPLTGRIPAPITPAYSQKATDIRRLKEALEVLDAKAIFYENEDYSRAIGWANELGVLVITGGTIGEKEIDFDLAFGPIDPASPAKILLTSGSTGSPKAVVISHYNLAQNAAQIRSTFDPTKEAQVWPNGIVMVNHLPWSHSLGGNAVLHMLTHSGGTLWIDDGAPTEAGLPKTIEAIKRVRPNYHLTVPLGWSLLTAAIEKDDELAHALFENLVIMQYGGAALTQDIYERLQAKAREIIGDEITVAAGYGATETGPTVCNVHWPNRIMGLVGLPVPGLKVKLVPIGEKFEARVKGPGIFPYYLADEAKTEAAFDEEGYYKLGDALAFYDDAKPQLGLRFNGRTSEEFKMLSGSFVQTGNVRLALIGGSNGLISDAIICGEGQSELGALVFINVAQCNLAIDEDLNMFELAQNQALRRLLSQRLLFTFKHQPATKAVKRIIVLDSPASLEAGEITDKGYLNQARCRESRKTALDNLYTNDAIVIKLD